MRSFNVLFTRIPRQANKQKGHTETTMSARIQRNNGQFPPPSTHTDTHSLTNKQKDRQTEEKRGEAFFPSLFFRSLDLSPSPLTKTGVVQQLLSPHVNVSTFLQSCSDDSIASTTLGSSQKKRMLLPDSWWRNT